MVIKGSQSDGLLSQLKPPSPTESLMVLKHRKQNSDTHSKSKAGIQENVRNT